MSADKQIFKQKHRSKRPNNKFSEFENWFSEEQINSIVNDFYKSKDKPTRELLKWNYSYYDYLQNAIGFLHDYFEYYVKDDDQSLKDRKTILKTTIQALSKDLDYFEFILDLEKNSARVERSEIDLFNYEGIKESFEYLINDTGFHKFLKHNNKKIVDV